jgi:GTP-binding protein HflX
VETVLAEIGVEDGQGSPVCEVWNKIDLLPPDEADAVRAEAARRDDVMTISAETGEGVDILRQRISDRLSAGNYVRNLVLDPSDGAGAAWLHQHGEVLEQKLRDDGLHVDVRLSDAAWSRFQAR